MVMSSKMELRMVESSKQSLVNDTRTEQILSQPSQPLNSSDSHDALLYITVVLAIYAVSIVVLLVKYIRRERREAVYDNYYVEFVKRDRFKIDGNFSKIVMEKYPSSGRYYTTGRNFSPV
jgi:hypothetical protein